MGHVLPEGNAYGAMSLASFTRPAEIIMLMEGCWYTHYCPTCRTYACGTSTACVGNLVKTRIHNDGANYAYWDGHVKWQKGSKMETDPDPWGHNGI